MPFDAQSDPPNDSPTDSTATAPRPGRKRRASISGARGVANLTPDQLAKKRANDREAQRAIRERTKNQIESLERKIHELTSQQPYQELQNVLRQKQAVEDENRDLKKSLNSILNIVQPLLCGRNSNDHARSTCYDTPASRSDGGPQGRAIPQNGNTITTILTPYSDTQRSPSVSSTQTSQLQDPWQISANSRTAEAIPQTSTFTNEYSLNQRRSDTSRETRFHTSNERVGSGFWMDGKFGDFKRQEVGDIRSAPPLPANSHITIGAPYAQNAIQGTRQNGVSDVQRQAYSVPVCNIGPTCPLDGLLLDFLAERRQRASEGYSESELIGPAYPDVTSLLKPERGKRAHPLSRVFTDILSTFPDLSALPEQVAVLYVMFLIMRWQISPTPDNYALLPEWVRPRSSQIFTPHPAWIDHVPWPLMRDKMVHNHQDYPFENYFIPYTTTLSLNWPYDPNDTLVPSPDSEEMSINPAFERHLRELSSWSLGPAFAKAHPALAETATIKVKSRDR